MTTSTAPRFFVAWLVIAAALSLAPASTMPTASAAAGDVVVADDTGDVSAVQPNTPAAPPSSAGLDITEASLAGVTGESFYARIKLADMKAEGATAPGPAAGFYATVTGGVTVQACWDWNGVLFGARVHYIMNTVPLVSDTKLGVVQGVCDAASPLAFQAGKVRDRFGVIVDAQESAVTFTVKRLMLANITQMPPPKAGEVLKDFRAFVADGKRLRIDAAPDTGVATDVLSFATDTANTDLRAFPDANVLASLACQGRKDIPTYAIQAGGKRGIPIVLENPAGAREALLAVDTLAGTDWKPRMMPKVAVPPAADGKPGNVTVNVIVDTPSGTKHKECSTIRVKATDAANPSAFGETSLNVVAVSPPGPAQKTLYMHAGPLAANTCSSQDVWLNTLQKDPDAGDPPREILFNNCRDPNPISTASGTFTPRIDVNPSHDLIINTSAVGASAHAKVVLRSDGVPTRARIGVVAVTGQQQIAAVAEGFKDVTIESSPTTVEIDLPIAFTRDSVPTGDPSRTLDARDGFGMAIRYTPLPADPNAPVGVVAGRVVLVPTGTSIELPIFAAVKRNVNDPGEKGGLLSLAPVGVLPEFARPGSLRLFNFTVLNEGAATDAAVVTAVMTGAPGWVTEIVPTGPIPLAPGASHGIQVGVTPPADAAESQAAILDLVVSSQSDPTARASISSKIVATRENSVPEEVLTGRVISKDDGGLLPGPGLLMAALAALVGGAAWGRRRA